MLTVKLINFTTNSKLWDSCNKSFFAFDYSRLITHLPKVPMVTFPVSLQQENQKYVC